MTDQEINETIALHLGWKKSEREVERDDGWQWTQKVVTWTSPDGRSSNTPHRYCSDLNAMHEAEMAITDEQHRLFRTYLGPVVGDVAYFCRKIISATARQRSEAFLRTIGKWRHE